MIIILLQALRHKHVAHNGVPKLHLGGDNAVGMGQLEQAVINDERGIEDFRRVLGDAELLPDFLRGEGAHFEKEVRHQLSGDNIAAVFQLYAAQARDNFDFVSDENQVGDAGIGMRQGDVADDQIEIFLNNGGEFLSFRFNAAEHVVQLERSDGDVLRIPHIFPVKDRHADRSRPDVRDESVSR